MSILKACYYLFFCCLVGFFLGEQYKLSLISDLDMHVSIKLCMREAAHNQREQMLIP